MAINLCDEDFQFNMCEDMRTLQEKLEIGDIVEYMDTDFKIMSGEIFHLREEGQEDVAGNANNRWVKIVDRVTTNPIVINIPADGTRAFIAYKPNELPPDFYKMLKESLPENFVPDAPDELADTPVIPEYTNKYISTLLGFKYLHHHISVEIIKTLGENCKSQLRLGDDIIKDLKLDREDETLVANFVAQHNTIIKDFHQALNTLKTNKGSKNVETRAITLIITELELASGHYQKEAQKRIRKIKESIALKEQWPPRDLGSHTSYENLDMDATLVGMEQTGGLINTLQERMSEAGRLRTINESVLESEANEMMEQIHFLNKEVQIKNNEIQNQVLRIQILESQVSLSKEVNTQQETIISELQGDARNQAAEIGNLQLKLALFEQSTTSKEGYASKLDALKEELEDSSSKIATLNEEVVAKQNKIDALQSELVLLKQSTTPIEDHASKLVALERKLESSSSKVSSLTEEVVAKESQVATLQSELALMKQSTKPIDDLVSKSESLERELKLSCSKISQLNEEVETKQKEIETLESQLKDANDVLSFGEAKVYDLEKELKRLTTQKKAESGGIELLSRDLALKDSKIEEQNQALMHMESELKCERKKLTERESEVVKCNKDYIEMSELLVTSKKSSADLLSKMASLDSELKILRQSEKTYQNTINNLKAQLNKPKESQRESETIKGMKDQIESLKKQLVESLSVERVNISDLSELEQLKSNSLLLQSELVKTKESLAQALKHNDSLVKLNRQLTSEKENTASSTQQSSSASIGDHERGELQQLRLINSSLEKDLALARNALKESLQSSKNSAQGSELRSEPDHRGTQEQSSHGQSDTGISDTSELITKLLKGAYEKQTNREEDEEELKVLIEKADVLMKKARAEFIVDDDDIHELTKEYLLKVVKEDFKSFEKLHSKLWELKWTLQKKKAPTEGELSESFKRVFGELQTVIKRLDDTKDTLRSEAKRRDISAAKQDVVLTSLLDPPTFDADVSSLHYFEWVEQFKSYLTSAHITFEDSGPYWRKALGGRAKTLIEQEFESEVVPKPDDLLHVLRKYFGDSASILEDILSELRNIGEIDSITSGKYSKILDKSNKVLKLIQKLRSLQRADPQLVKQNGIVEKALLKTLSPEFYHHYEIKKETNPEAMLKHFTDIISINQRQAREKTKHILKSDTTERSHKNDIKQEKPEKKKNYNSYSSQVQDSSKDRTQNSQSRYVREYLPTKELSCPICMFFPKAVKKNEPHIIVITKTQKKATIIEACPIWNSMPIKDRHELLTLNEICQVCYSEKLTSFHSAQKCQLTKKLPFLKCRECPNRFFTCFKHLKSNEDRFKALQDRISEANGVVSMITWSTPRNIPNYQPIENHSFISNTETSKPLMYGSKDALLKSVNKELLLPEQEGEPCFIFSQMIGDDGKEYLITYDSCSHFSLCSEEIIGTGLRAAEVDLPYRTSVSGIGGSRTVTNASLLIPLASGQYQEICAQVLPSIMTNYSDQVQDEAKLLKNTYKLDGGELSSDIDYPKFRQQVHLLVGIKDLSLFPTKIYTTATGLAIFQTKIRTRNSKFGKGFALGGNLSLAHLYQEKYGINFLAEARKLDGAICEKIPEIYIKPSEKPQYNESGEEIYWSDEEEEEEWSNSTEWIEEDNLDMAFDVLNHQINGENQEARRYVCDFLQTNKFEKEVSIQGSTPLCYKIIPFDETRYQYINKTVSNNFRLSTEELERMLCGVDAERLFKCPSCMNCAQCQKSLQNSETSIKSLQEDLLFKDCLKIDPNTGAIIASLPLGPDYREQLTNNKIFTERRLRRELAKIANLPESKQQVKEAFEKYRTRGFMKKFEELTLAEQEAVKKESLQHYLSISIAYKFDSISSKARICCDASCEHLGKSLNKILPIGSLDLNISRCMQTFLTFPSIVTGDISSFFNSFFLDPKQLHVHQISFIPSLDPKEDPETFYLMTLYFGISSVSKLTSMALELLGQTYPHLDDIFTRLTYVVRSLLIIISSLIIYLIQDDVIIPGFNNEATAEKCREFMDCMGNHNLKFKGTCQSRGKVDPEITDDLGLVGYLGLGYFAPQDYFYLKIPKFHLNKKVKGQVETLRYFSGSTVEELKEFMQFITLRTILSKTMAYWDCTGIISVILSRFRQLVREANKLAQGVYDQPLPETILDRFCHLVINMEKLREYKYPRTHHLPSKDEQKFEILAFSDAGLHAKTVVQYTKSVDQPINTVSFLSAKNYLCKAIDSIARSELDACFKNSLLVEAQTRNLSPYIVKKVCFIDSMICCHWILNDAVALQVYQRTRVLQIRKTFTDENGILQIYWTSGKGSNNPANTGK